MQGIDLQATAPDGLHDGREFALKTGRLPMKKSHLRFAEIPCADERSAHSGQQTSFRSQIAAVAALFFPGLGSWQVRFKAEEIEKIGTVIIYAVGITAGGLTFSTGCGAVPVHDVVGP